ncbi:MAG: hypothetical protein PHP69_00890 [Candidatus Omnitrophica bacterium]|nr:hypothetical protein [Candidatus Omnitrophota bacterium]MDD5080964.1 hypothetical protein [Candidatus Omnitrophota bacterium]MDD5440607.1 hypothetical protein [Candidatus Omnitrophota bacterium]
MEINLRPIESSNTLTDSQKKSVYFISSTVVFAAILIAICYFSLVFTANSQKNKINDLKQTYAKYVAIETEVATIKKNNSQLSLETGIYNEFVNKRKNWAEKIYALSKHTPVAMWFKDVNLNNKEIKIHGFLSPFMITQRPIAVISDFFKDLRSDERFYNSILDYQLQNLRVTSYGKKDAVEFNIRFIMEN